jgi:hypothetical protein
MIKFDHNNINVMYEGEKMKSFTQIEKCQWICVETMEELELSVKSLKEGTRTPQFY